MSKKNKKLPDLGVQKKQGWVQTERAAHQAWAMLLGRKPRAGALLHVLVANMGNQNAVVVSQDLLARMMDCSVRTIRRAIKDLSDENWIEVQRIGKGKESVYIVNDRVAWAQSRDKKVYLSRFSASVVVDMDDQPEIKTDSLRQIPVMFQGEAQLPTGKGEPPPVQPCFDGLEPDLPAIQAIGGGDDQDYREELEKIGQQRLD